MAITTPDKIGREVINLSGNTQKSNIVKVKRLLRYGYTSGYLVEVEDSIFIVPTNIKALAAEALQWFASDFISRQAILAAMQQAGLVEIEDLIAHLENGTPHEVYDVLVRDREDEAPKPDPTKPANWGGFPTPQRKLRFATLICFEGAEAGPCAAAYADHVKQSMGGKIMGPEQFLLGNSYDCKICCVELHDCQKHPLKG